MKKAKREGHKPHIILQMNFSPQVKKSVLFYFKKLYLKACKLQYDKEDS